MASQTDLVLEPEQVTASWLTRALSGDAPTGRGPLVRTFAAERIGTGQVGRNIRFHLEWEPAGAGPASIVAKFASDDPTSRATGVAVGTYVREVGFYRQLAPLVRARIPRCHHAAIDEATGGFCLLLEDMSASVPGDQIAGGTPDQAAAAVEEVARLHAPLWGTPSPSPYPWMERYRTGDAGNLQRLYMSVVDGFADRYGDRLGDQVMTVVRRFGPLITAWTSERGGPRTVVHGDYRLDNLLFGPPDCPVAIVDWQTVTTGSGVSDAAYFIGAGLLPEERRAHEMGLLRLYHRALVAQGVDDLSWNDCVTGYRRHSFDGLLMAVVASMIVGAAERGDAMFCAMAERHALQVLDMDAFDLIAAG